MKRLASLLTLGSGLALACLLPAAAQPAPHSDGAMMMHHGMMEHGMAHCGRDHHGGMMLIMHPDGTLAFLHAELHITPNEEPQWSAFAAAVHDSANQVRQDMEMHRKDHAAMQGPMDFKAMLAHHEAMAEMHLRIMKRIDGALVPLYESLNPQQQHGLVHMLAPCGGPHDWHHDGMGPHPGPQPGPHSGM